VLRVIQGELLKEAKVKLKQLNGLKDPIEIAQKYARYEQTVNIIKMLGGIIYKKDKESSDAYSVEVAKRIESLEESVILSED